jgi:hypothetical protein
MIIILLLSYTHADMMWFRRGEYVTTHGYVQPKMQCTNCWYKHIQPHEIGCQHTNGNWNCQVFSSEMTLQEYSVECSFKNACIIQFEVE